MCLCIRKKKGGGGWGGGVLSFIKIYKKGGGEDINNSIIQMCVWPGKTERDVCTSQVREFGCVCVPVYRENGRRSFFYKKY